jgi:hypothetical protein
VSNKFRRTELTGCSQDEKEIVDFNWIIIIINVRLKILNIQKDADRKLKVGPEFQVKWSRNGVGPLQAKSIEGDPFISS